MKNVPRCPVDSSTGGIGTVWLIKTPRLSWSQSKLKRRDNEKRILLAYNFVCGLQTTEKLSKEDFMSYTDDLHSLSHTKWNCKYHIVFAPKYRRKAFYDARRVEVGQILRKLCEWKGVNIIEAEVCPDHEHMLVEIPPKMSVSGFMGYLKGKSSQLIYERWANARFKYRNREFWCRGYYVDTVGKNTKKIKEYIQNQLKEDQMAEQVQLEFEDPFTGNEK